MKTCAILRTNVGLTTNCKLVVDSQYNLFIDSIESTPELSQNRFKKFRFSKDAKWDEILPVYYKNVPSEVSFKIKFDDDVDNMSSNFSNQYDDLYQYGARNIIENKFYTEEYEYFAPLHIDNNNLPSNFIIFRVDGPGLLSLNKDNFKSEIIAKLKCVKNFDLTTKTVLGQWIDNNFISNKRYPNASLYIDFRRLEFSSWSGVDYESGGYVEKTIMLDSTLELEQPYLEMEKLILNGYRDNGVIYPNILNFNFLFDDTPATPERLRKWSLNRYLGFYFDELTQVIKVSPNNLPLLKPDVFIDKGNILKSSSSPSPFLEDWKVGEYPYIEIDGNFYFVEKFEEASPIGINKIQTSPNSFEDKITRVSNIKYKVLSDIRLNGLTASSINQNLVKLTSDGFIQKQNGDDYQISDYDSSDVWLIEIGNRLHNIILSDGKFKIYSDFGFNQSDENFEFFINGGVDGYMYTIPLFVSRDVEPVAFKIYKCKFTDIKDFDTDIIETDYSKFEYLQDNQITETDETKMFTVDLNSTSQPKSIVEFKLQNVPINLPTSSEYTANSETFRIQGNELTNLWRKNTERIKWGFKGSISSNDYPYLLNNSLLSENFNRAPSTKDVLLSRQSRNLDYFYSVNSESNSYRFHSLHVEDISNGVINKSFNFEIDKYLGINYNNDYFDYFFGKKVYFNKGEISQTSQKWSYFLDGDTDIPNITLFKGLKFSLSEVQNINIVENKIEKINLKNSNKFKGWKFSILLSSNDYIITNKVDEINSADIIRAENNFKWRIIDTWKHEKDYGTNSLVLFEESLYINPNSSSRITNPSFNPAKSSDWQLFDQKTIFYNPNIESTILSGLPQLIYYYQDFYYSNDTGDVNIWDPSSSYNVDDKVIYGDFNWISLQDQNTSIPSESSYFITNQVYNYYWKKIEPTVDTNVKWKKVPVWKDNLDYGKTSSWPEFQYVRGNYVIHENIVWGSTYSPSVGVPPNLDTKWSRIYSMEPDTNYLYGDDITKNNILELNGKFYQCLSNQPQTIDPDIFYNYSLDNGIMIIINEKYKNVLVNIYVNDNTYSEFDEVLPKKWEKVRNEVRDTNRDDIYSIIFSKLSANNFMHCINDLSNKFGFSDLIKYVIVKPDSTIEIYDANNLNSLKKLPYLLKCDPPDRFLVKLRSLKKEPLTLQSSEIKAKRILKNSNIESLSEINFYNEMHLASKITQNLTNPVLFPNFSGLTNQNYGLVYRFSGYYSPILKNIELFESPGLTQSYGNYKFDTSLTDFGLMRQRIVSKVNRRSNILKLRNNPNLKSVFPMLDEFGYHVVDSFIFKSTWDYEYYFECVEYEPEIELKQILTKRKKTKSPQFRNFNSKLL